MRLLDTLRSHHDHANGTSSDSLGHLSVVLRWRLCHAWSRVYDKRPIGPQPGSARETNSPSTNRARRNWRSASVGIHKDPALQRLSHLASIPAGVSRMGNTFPATRRVIPASQTGDVLPANGPGADVLLGSHHGVSSTRRRLAA